MWAARSNDYHKSFNHSLDKLTILYKSLSFSVGGNNFPPAAKKIRQQRGGYFGVGTFRFQVAGGTYPGEIESLLQTKFMNPIF